MLDEKEDAEKLLDSAAENMEIICTGRNAPDWLIEKADLVTEMKQIKHYYDKGIMDGAALRIKAVLRRQAFLFHLVSVLIRSDCSFMLLYKTASIGVNSIVSEAAAIDVKNCWVLSIIDSIGHRCVITVSYIFLP